MSGPRIVHGARVPLFDRLVDGDPATTYEPHPPRMLDPKGVRESVGRELDRLLNTRTPLAVDELDRRQRSTIDYGIPDLSLFRPYETDSEHLLVEVIERTIAAFEPRLANPRVSVERLAGERRSLLARIEGTIVVGTMVEPVSFPVLLRDSVSEPDE
ncbi:type VI secretion system baseplate subunit TssE [Arenibaculum sp.]|uniref:type VI secretion system baseplate subunit TssE n=1 Tax=Arenibaculum sp. TaxID=2865862 RepID=UPI002E15A912|nr:type VI secretion system baseplate subunit TssE [Arenibaculum sp.]